VSNTTQTADLEGVMRHDSSQVLGSQQLAGAVVTARGSGMRHAARVPASGLVGAVALEYAAARYTARRPSQTPKFGHTAFLAVNEREVALIKTGGGRLKDGSAEVLARIPRSEVTGAGVSRGFLRSNLTINFADGGSWAFEVSPFIRSTIVRIVRALGY
jgi:hypothetical protein